jgi:hypothetical protein
MVNGQKTRAFSELQSHYLFAEKFGRPAKGNGEAEGLIGYARRDFMVAVPSASSWEDLNQHLEADCRKRRERRLRGHTETLGERFERDRAALLPLPASPYEALLGPTGLVFAPPLTSRSRPHPIDSLVIIFGKCCNSFSKYSV